MILHSHTAGQGPALVILHGLFGSWENWGSLSKKLSTEFSVIGLDLRNHGASGHSETMNYNVMADDVLETLEHLGIDRFHLLGHSMGGKVAMTLSGRNLSGANPENLLPASTSPAATLERLIVVDIAPRTYPPHHVPLLRAMQALDTDSIGSRAEADRELAASITEPAVRQFLLKSLQRTESGSYRWEFNLPVLAAEYENIMSMPDALTRAVDNPVLVLRGSESDYVSPADEPLLAARYSNLRINTINGAGHWLHATHTDEVYQSILFFLANPD